MHSGELQLEVVVTQNESSIDGPAELVLHYQVCTNEYCLEPAQVVLPVEIAAGG